MMKRKFISWVMKTQGDSTSVSCTCAFNEIPSSAIDHRCGACHNTFDAKVRTNLWDKYGIIKKVYCLFAYLFTTVRKAYISYPGFQPLGCKCLLYGNASWCIGGVLMSLQRSIHLALKPSWELLVVLNDPGVLISDAGTGWALSWILVKFVINLYLRLWIGSSVPSGAPGFYDRHDMSWRSWNMKGFLLVGDPWDFVPHLMRSGGVSCVSATWRVLTGGSSCTSFGFPAAS